MATTLKKLAIQMEQFHLISSKSALEKMESGEVKLVQETGEEISEQEKQEIVEAFRKYQESMEFFESFYEKHLHGK